MILQSLNTLYDRLAADDAYDLAEPGFSPQKISFKVVLNPDGSLFEIQDARVKNSEGRSLPARMKVIGDGKRSGSKPVPFLTWDNALYLLGLPPKDRSQAWANERFESFREKQTKISEKISCPFLDLVCRFLAGWTPENLKRSELLTEITSHYGVFQLRDESKYLHAAPELVSWWKEQFNTEATPDGQCLVTGKSAKIARLHPTIKGVTPPKGKQQQDGPLVSIDKGKNAFSSYLKEQSYNSPVSEFAAFRYGTALNALLNGPQSSRHRLRIGDTTCVFWTDQPTILEDIFAEIAGVGSAAAEEAQDPEVRAKVEAFLKALRTGREAYGDLGQNPDETHFFLLGLAPNAARLSVRFFYQSSISEFLDHLRKHRQDIEIVREFDHPVGKRRADPEFPAYWEFLRETVRHGDDPAPLLGGALLRAILEGSDYPLSLFTALLRRIHMERSVNYLRAAAIKAVLVRNHQTPITPMLDPENTRSPYLLGRLFAVLEKIQEEGHREQTGRSLDKTIRETYFSSACATPGSVFPRLEQLSTHHRRHLNPGRKIQFDQLISEIKWPFSPESGTPRSLNLEEQGLFILGYYHQRKALFTSKPKTDEAVA